MKIDTFKKLHKKYPHISGKANRFSNHPRSIDSKLDSEQSIKNLWRIIDTLNDNDIKHTVVFGTLLGIYRDNALIEHDTDTDLAIWVNDDCIIKLIELIEDKGFSLTRFDRHIISFSRGENYTDLYIYDEISTNRLVNWKGFGELSNEDFSGRHKIKFRGRYLNCVQYPEKHFESWYGNDWKTPKKGISANIIRNRKNRKNDNIT